MLYKYINIYYTNIYYIHICYILYKYIKYVNHEEKKYKNNKKYSYRSLTRFLSSSLYFLNFKIKVKRKFQLQKKATGKMYNGEADKRGGVPG